MSLLRRLAAACLLLQAKSVLLDGQPAEELVAERNMKDKYGKFIDNDSLRMQDSLKEAHQGVRPSPAARRHACSALQALVVLNILFAIRSKKSIF